MQSGTKIAGARGQGHAHLGVFIKLESEVVHQLFFILHVYILISFANNDPYIFDHLINAVGATGRSPLRIFTKKTRLYQTFPVQI